MDDFEIENDGDIYDDEGIEKPTGAIDINKESEIFEKSDDKSVLNLKKGFKLEVGSGRMEIYKESPPLTPKQKDLAETRNKIYMLLMQKKRREATEEVVNFCKRYIQKINTIRNDEISEMYIYDDASGLRIPEGKTRIKEMAREVLGEAFTGTFVNEVIAKIEADTYVNQDEFLNHRDPDRIWLLNGIYNFKTREFEQFHKDKISFIRIPVKYDKNAKCPNFIKHLKTVLRKEEDVLVIQEMFGYCLYPENKYEIAFFFLGEGSNGKSKTLEVLKIFLGGENCESISLAEFELNQYAKCELFNKLANIAGDISNHTIKDSSTFKALVGRDLITANRKFLTPISFVNTAKLIFVANELPRSYDMTKGFLRRWMPFDFPYDFVDEKEYEMEEKKEFKKIKDPDIVAKMSTPEELSGMFNWAIEGLDRLLKNKDFSKSHSVDEIRQIWIRKSDSFTAFCGECLKSEYNAKISKKTLREAYHAFCRKYGLKIASEKAIKETLNRLFAVWEDQDYENGERFWVGVSPLGEFSSLLEGEITGITGITGFSMPMQKNKIPMDIQKGVIPVIPVIPSKKTTEIDDENADFSGASVETEVINMGSNPETPPLHMELQENEQTEWERLLLEFKQKNELYVINLVVEKDFKSENLIKWKTEGRIFESRPDFIRLSK